jgi:hypothetical protein
MSDKMLMENWRKFLNEEGPTTINYGEEYQADLDREQASALGGLGYLSDEEAAGPAEQEKADCYTLSDLLNYIEEFKRADKKAKKQMEDWRQKEMAADLGKSLVAGALMTVATGGLTIPAAIGAGAGATLVGWITNKSGEYSVNPPSESELANSRFLDKLDLHPVFDVSLSPQAVQHGRTAWQELVAKKLEGFEKQFGNVCYGDLDNLVADAIPDINVFMQTYHNLCRSEHEYKGQGGDLSQSRYAEVEPVKSDIYELWRKYLKEEELIKESIGDFYDTLDEDGLYDLDLEDLLDLRDFIEDFGGPGPQSDPKDLYPTIMARIEAIEEFEDHTPPPDRKIEGLYDGEFAMRLLKAFFSSANSGIELAAMIPGAESLSEEFSRIRGHVARLVEYAEDGNDYPWLTIDETEGHPDVLTNDVRMLLVQMMGTEFEGEMDEEQKEVIAGYHNWLDSIHNLKGYAAYDLHGRKKAGYPPPPWITSATGAHKRYEHAYEFLSKWVGGETE